MLLGFRLDKEFVARNKALSELMDDVRNYYYEPIKLLCEEYNNRILMGIKSEGAYAKKVCEYIESTAEDKIDTDKLDKALIKLDTEEKIRTALIDELDVKYFSLRDNLYKRFAQASKRIFGDFENLFCDNETFKKKYIIDSLREYKEFDMEIEKIIDSNISKFIDHRQFGKLKKIVEGLYIKILNFNKDLQHRRLLKTHSK